MLRFPPPPPFVFALLFSLEEPAQTRQIPLSEASKTAFGGRTLWYVFSPQNRTVRFAPPPPISPLSNRVCVCVCAQSLW